MLDIPKTPTITRPHAVPRRTRGARSDWRYRVNIVARVLAGTVGAYAIAAFFAAAVARLTPLPRLDAVLPATMLAFVVFVPAVLWAFLARSAARAWAGIAIIAALFALMAWLAGPPA